MMTLNHRIFLLRYIFILLIIPNFAFAQSTSGLKSYDGKTAVNNITAGSVIEFNEDISIDQFRNEDESYLVQSFNYVDGESLGRVLDGFVINQTACGIYYYANKRGYQILKDSGGFIIPKGTSAVVKKSAEKDDWYTIYFNFDETNKDLHIYDKTKSTKLVVQGAQISCYLGLGAWWKNSDKKLHVKNVLFNFGERISIFKHYIKKEMTKNDQVEAYIVRLEYLLHLLADIETSTTTSASGVSNNYGNSNLGDAEYINRIINEILDIYSKIEELLKYPEMRNLVSDIYLTLDEIRKEIDENVNRFRPIIPKNTINKYDSNLMSSTKYDIEQVIQKIEAPLPNKLRLHSLFVDDDNVMYVSAGYKQEDQRLDVPAGLFISRDGGKLFSHVLKDRYISAVNEDKKGNTYVGTYSGLYISQNQGEDFSIALEKPIEHLFIDKNDNIYVGTESGLYISQNQGVSFSKKTDYPVRAEALYVDDDGVIYMGGMDGIAISGYGRNINDAVLGHILSIAVDKEGVIYLGTFNQGLLISRDGGKTFSQGNLKVKHIAFLHIDEKGKLYVGTSHNGAYISNDRGETFSKVEGSTMRGNRLFSVDSEGKMYLGNDKILKFH